MFSTVLGSLPRPQSLEKRESRVLPWRFVRQSVYRPAFDTRTQLLLAEIVPARVNDLDTMHPVVGPGTTEWVIGDGCFKLRGVDPGSGRWMYAFNAFSCHELTLGRVPVGASIFWNALAADDDHADGEATLLRLLLTSLLGQLLETSLTVGLLTFALCGTHEDGRIAAVASRAPAAVPRSSSPPSARPVHRPPSGNNRSSHAPGVPNP